MIPTVTQPLSEGLIVRLMQEHIAKNLRKRLQDAANELIDDVLADAMKDMEIGVVTMAHQYKDKLVMELSINGVNRQEQTRHEAQRRQEQ